MKALKFLSLALFGLLTSCNSMKYLYVRIDYTPNRSFKPGPSTLLIINKFDANNCERCNERKIRAIKAGAIAALKAAKKELEQLPNMKLITLADTVDLKLNNDSIKSLAIANHADNVLALNNFWPTVYLSESIDGTNYYNNKIKIDFALFDNNGILTTNLNTIINEPLFEIPDKGIIANILTYPTVGGNKDAIIKSAEHATKIALKDYLPYYVSHMRPIYNEDWIQPATSEILVNNFAMADSLLRPFLEESNNEHAGKAAYQLAVVYEAQGQVEKAIKMVNLSIDKFETLYARFLLADLKTE